jgi:hypothetical protein
VPVRRSRSVHVPRETAAGKVGFLREVVIAWLSRRG